MNAKVLVFCEGIWLAHTARPLVVAEGLRAAGCRVEFAASGKFASLAADAGFKVHPAATMDPAKALAAVRSLRIGYDRALIEAYVEDELTLLKRIGPDFVLNDFRLPAAISCPLAGVPLVNILNAYMTNFYAPVRRSPGDLVTTRILGRRLSTALLPPVMKAFLKLHVRPFNTVAKSRRLAPFANLFDVMASPDLNLICDLPDFAPLTGAPGHFKYIGPIVWEPNLPAPGWLASVDRSRPAVYFTMGSTGFQHYYRILKAAFAGTDYQVLITTGGVSDPGQLPDNFHVAALAPALSILDKSDLVICHGGNGTIYQALSKAVPVLGIPTFHDQDFNMQRVVDLRLGAALWPRSLTGKTLREAADRLLADDEVQASARAFAAKINAADAVRSAVKFIDRFLALTTV